MAEGARLESECAPKGYRGFKSLSLRQFIEGNMKKDIIAIGFMLFVVFAAGLYLGPTPATAGSVDEIVYELRMTRRAIEKINSQCR